MDVEEATEELRTVEDEEVEDEAEATGVRLLLLQFTKKQAQLQQQAQTQHQAQDLAQALDQEVQEAQAALNEPRLQFRD